jgi:hypothetical protein
MNWNCNKPIKYYRVPYFKNSYRCVDSSGSWFYYSSSHSAWLPSGILSLVKGDILGEVEEITEEEMETYIMLNELSK